MDETPPKQKIIVGLGNPGKYYELTRHNLGYLVVQELAKELQWEFKENKYIPAWVAKGQFQNAGLHLLLPKTYMNESGRAVRSYLDFFKLTPENLIIVVDDIALPFGEMRLRQLGSSGNHNGLKSIEMHLKTQNYVRLRMGIGAKPTEIALADYVLAPFSKEEFAILESFVQKGVEVLKRLINENITNVMSTLNKKIEGKG